MCTYMTVNRSCISYIKPYAGIENTTIVYMIYILYVEQLVLSPNVFLIQIIPITVWFSYRIITILFYFLKGNKVILMNSALLSLKQRK